MKAIEVIRIGRSRKRLASIAAPLCVPPLLGLGGTGLVFGVFAAFFVLAAASTWGLPERRGRELDEDLTDDVATAASTV